MVPLRMLILLGGLVSPDDSTLLRFPSLLRLTVGFPRLGHVHFNVFSSILSIVFKSQG